MKNYAVGKTKGALVSRALRALVLASLLACNAMADPPPPPRRSWIFEQLSGQSPPTLTDQTRHEITLDVANYESLVSGQASATVDFRELEIHVQASQRSVLPTDGELGPLGSDYRTLGIEIARYHSLSDKYYGRMGLGYLQFFPDSRRWLKLDIATGIFPTADVPWEFRLNVQLYFNISRGEDLRVLAISTETLRDFTRGGGRFQLGAFFNWTNFMIGAVYPEYSNAFKGNVVEDMGFSLGPLFYWRTSIGDLRVAVPLRLYVDRDLSQAFTNYPSDFLGPQLDLRWTMPL